MSEAYNTYLYNHISNVQKGYIWLKEHLPYTIFEVENQAISTNTLIEEHDKSKYSPEEYDAYDKYFYGGNRSYSVVKDFNYAWLHHIHMNPHHWQYWVLIHDDPEESEEILEMPGNYIIEMVCDWWAFSWQKEDLYEIFSWYDSHKDYIKLAPTTRKTVEIILKNIKVELDKNITGGNQNES